MKPNQHYHLFGGEHSYCLPGMDGYIDEYEDVEHAMKAAEGGQYDWAHIVEVAPVGLQIVQVGKWNPGLKRMVWQADYSPLKYRDQYIKTFCSVMKSGILLISKISASRNWSTKSRVQLISNALSLYDDIQLELGTMGIDQQNTSLHLARQIIEQMLTCMRRVQFSYNEKLEWNRWSKNAAALLDSTKDLSWYTDQWDKNL